MEFRVSGDWRGRQTRGYATFAGAPLYPRADKSELNRLFPDTTILNTINNLENPLQKNLGDSFKMDRTGVEKTATLGRGERYDVTEGLKATSNTKQSLNLGANQQTPRRGEFFAFPAFFGITNYISGFFHNLTGAMPFHQNRPATPEKVPEAAFAFAAPEEIYYDSEPRDSGFDECSDHDASPPIDEVDAVGNFSRRDCAKNSAEASENKTDDCRAQCDARIGCGGDMRARAESARDPGAAASPSEAAEHCRDKMARIQDLLAGKSTINPKSPTKTPSFPFTGYKPRPRKVFVEPRAVSVDCVDNFKPEALARTGSVAATKFVCPGRVTVSELVRAASHPKLKVETERNDTSQGIEDDSTKIGKTTNVSLNSEKNDVKDKSEPGHIGIETKPAVTVMSATENKHLASCDIKVNENASDLADTLTQNNSQIETEQSTPIDAETKAELISSCEDKVSRLKALLSERKKKNREPQKAEESLKPVEEPLKPIDEPQKPVQAAMVPEKTMQAPPTDIKDAINSEYDQKVDTRRSPEKSIPVPTRHRRSKHHKNPNRLDARKQKRKQLRRNIDEDLCFARDTDDAVASSENDSPKIVLTPPKHPEGFDEVHGRFNSNGETEDPFVIVFSDSPNASPSGSPRSRLPSDCGSDDSFIICFEDDEGATPSCFTSEDVFGSDSDLSDTDSDSGCESNLVSNTFSRTISDLTDESLYQDDGEVFAKSANVLDSDDEETSSPERDEQTCVSSTGMMLTEEKKMARRILPPKKVRFSDSPPQVRVMRVWLYAARQARASNWRQVATDNERFRRRIADVDMAISWVLKPQHRSRVKFQRFMPWWHAQRRQEVAERKVAEEKRLEEEKLLEEEKRVEEERLLEEKRLEEEKGVVEETIEKGKDDCIENDNCIDVLTAVNVGTGIKLHGTGNKNVVNKGLNNQDRKFRIKQDNAYKSSVDFSKPYQRVVANESRIKRNENNSSHADNSESVKKHESIRKDGVKANKIIGQNEITGLIKSSDVLNNGHCVGQIKLGGIKSVNSDVVDAKRSNTSANISTTVGGSNVKRYQNLSNHVETDKMNACSLESSIKSSNHDANSLESCVNSSNHDANSLENCIKSSNHDANSLESCIKSSNEVKTTAKNGLLNANTIANENNSCKVVK